MAYSYVRYTGNGTTTNYTFPFSYLSSDHVKVRLDGVLTTQFSFLNGTTIQLFSAPAEGTVIEIRRETPKDNPIVNFTDGSVLLERDLDLVSTFNLYVSQESDDLVGEVMNVDATDNWNAEGKRIRNLAAAQNSDEAVNKQQLDYEYPAVQAVAAVAGAVNIVGSDLGAVTGQITDLGLITDPVTSNPDTGSSRIVVVAENIADVNVVSDNIAAVQAVNNNLAAVQNASSNATSAAASASAASTSASSAASSATSAGASATTASNKATEAATSATSASSSATSAAASASTATTKASEASASALSASTSASSASTSASSASTSATSATSSAAAAAASETSAASSASSASTSATNAASSASTASTAATTATTKASEASASATSASSSATSAASSATSAASSATSAAASAASAAALLDNFDDRYLGPKAAAPTVDNDGDPLVVGALYFDTTTGKMRAYTSTGWVDASSAAQAALTVYRYSASAGQTTFSGASLNSTTLAYIAGGIVVTLNGIVLVGGGDDYTATNGTSVVLTAAASAGDLLEVYAFSSFSLASLNGSAIVNQTVTDDKFAPVLDLGIL